MVLLVKNPLFQNKMNLCRFQNSLGTPKQGIHALRIPGTDAAAADVLMSLGLVWFLAAVPKIPITFSFLIVFGGALILHLVFCVQTAGTKFINGQ